MWKEAANERPTRRTVQSCPRDKKKIGCRAKNGKETRSSQQRMRQDAGDSPRKKQPDMQPKGSTEGEKIPSGEQKQGKELKCKQLSLG